MKKKTSIIKDERINTIEMKGRMKNIVKATKDQKRAAEVFIRNSIIISLNYDFPFMIII
jgi:hypothetical protein